MLAQFLYIFLIYSHVTYITVERPCDNLIPFPGLVISPIIHYHQIKNKVLVMLRLVTLRMRFTAAITWSSFGDVFNEYVNPFDWKARSASQCCRYGLFLFAVGVEAL